MRITLPTIAIISLTLLSASTTAGDVKSCGPGLTTGDVINFGLSGGYITSATFENGITDKCSSTTNGSDKLVNYEYTSNGISQHGSCCIYASTHTSEIYPTKYGIHVVYSPEEWSDYYIRCAKDSTLTETLPTKCTNGKWPNCNDRKSNQDLTFACNKTTGRYGAQAPSYRTSHPA